MGQWNGAGVGVTTVEFTGTTTTKSTSGTTGSWAIDEVTYTAPANGA